MGKIVTFHHHLMPIPQTGRERNILLDSGDLMRLLTDNGVDLVLNGHKHVPNVWMVEKMVTLNSGTATTRKLRGQTRPCYNQLSFEDEDFVVNLVDTETGRKKNSWQTIQLRLKMRSTWSVPPSTLPRVNRILRSFKSLIFNFPWLVF